MREREREREGGREREREIVNDEILVNMKEQLGEH